VAVTVSEAQAGFGRVERERQMLHYMSSGADDAAAFWTGMPVALALSATLWVALVATVLALLAL
jgi:hypothetical protein